MCAIENFLVPHVGCVVRTRVMCQAGWASAACERGDDVVAWLCERAPLWVVVRVRYCGTIRACLVLTRAQLCCSAGLGEISNQ